MAKVALVHDYLKEYGGAERVLETLHQMFPEAPIYTTFYSPEYLGPHRSRLTSWDIRTTWLQYVPFKNKLVSYFRFIAPWVFGSIDLSAYDIVITSTAGTYTSPNFVKIGKQTKLICYCHTPPRYLYGYATAASWKHVWWRRVLFFFGQLPMYFLRKLDFQAAQRPTIYIANSKEVMARIKRFYKREALVIYPPVDVSSQNIATKKYEKTYFLVGGRLARPKHIDLAVAACTTMGVPLRVFGKAFSGYGEELRDIAGPTVTFLGEVSDEEKWKLYKGAKAFIFPAEDEDFGIMPVESMAVGTPVIAYRSGGVKETVIDGKTGLFFDTLESKSIIATIQKYEQTTFVAKDCYQQAEKFSKETFIRKMKEVLA